MTYKELYAFGAAALTECGIEDAKLDARLLLEEICHTTRNDFIVHSDRIITEAEETEYKEYVDKRKHHIPLAYIIGRQEFMGLKFIVDANVLIPRQDTEILVEEAMLVTHDGMRVLDICTGSGCILLSLMHYKNDCEGIGADISEEALQTANKNAKKMGINAKFIQSNLLEKVEGQFDIIVSNPPYIETEVIKTLMPEVKDKEPIIALDGGKDGLFFYREILKQVKPHLKKESILLFEIGYNQSKSVEELMRTAGFAGVKTIQDLSGLDRVVTGTYLEELCLID